MKYLQLLPPLLLILQSHEVHMNTIEKIQDCAWSCSEVCKLHFYSLHKRNSVVYVLFICLFCMLLIL